MSIDHDRIVDYLARYADTLTNLDAEAAADLWTMPGMIADDRFSGVLISRSEMIEGLKQSYPLYRKLGLASVGYDVVDEHHLTGNLVLVRVRWRFFDADGELLTDSSAYYLLRAVDTDLRATACIQVDDVEKLRALASARGVDLTPPAE
ncbi:hypothetical protein [Agromyces sp. LHK192]|uniref:hypothetical protein n=1 Tax=Agromyces sp. LHK192 TaxID=2498704 RepID=UPI000FD92BD0|nr:hypothetical protein [Agromyces sp. LHK192]